MFAIFPIVSLILLVLIGSKLFQHKREALLGALMAWAVIVTVLTEGLSLIRGFNPVLLTLTWFLITAGLGVFLWQAYGPRLIKAAPGYWLNPAPFINLPVTLKLSTVGMTIALLAIGVTAVMAAPNHSDSMEYHLSRIMHWIQNGTVAHYPSHNIFQLYQNPWSEFAIAHLQILSNGDYLSNSVQWVSMIGSMFGISLIAKELGAGRNGQILAAIFAGTMPMAVLQGSSTNNDHVVTLWMVCFVYFALVTMGQGLNPIRLVCLGTSLGLAILTKGTAYIYAFPFCIWLLIWGIRRLKWRMVKPMVGILAIAIVINAGHYFRNYALFGTPLGSPGDETGTAVGLTYLMSNVVRNLALHADIVRNLHLDGLMTPTTGLTEKAITIFHNIIGVDVSDPAITSAKESRFYVPSISFNEDKAGNPLHLAIILISSGLLLINSRLQQRRRLFIYWLTTTATFLLFCQLLTWSSSRCRLHLPIFVLFAALVGTVIGHSLNRRVVNILTIFLVLLSLQWVFNNDIRPLTGENNIFASPRSREYFNTQPALEGIYTNAASEINNQSCTNIGMVFENISFEYPQWLLLNAPRRGFQIQHVNLDNESEPLSSQPRYSRFEPCLIMKTASRDVDAPLEAELQVDGKRYREIWQQTEEARNSQKSVQLFATN
ncbi:pmt family 4-amino-4-deoxy-l-arabinose transferase [Leptolyngbya sp. Heron Island J]|uniref:ArnT family glycosyltransferase n=1 Tax=Leptolyngbya sp. Heron Island J TaxID=1385935 RepID=UPI0003B9DB2F|nr:glycosyltransferase family 39 protein [Leptolyngbya sp. Heron Island J]ESA36479.1 pmt family 4-amino-4-deoxy-l-arabinose transferase [Leptolyngbya sp. Heron Island J]